MRPRSACCSTRSESTADDAAVLAFLAAEQRVWRPAHVLEPDVVAMLDGIRARGLKVGLVSNLFDPPVLMRELFRELGCWSGSMRSPSRPRSARESHTRPSSSRPSRRWASRPAKP